MNTENKPRTLQCLRCGAAFECNPGPDCWCAKLPPTVAPVPGSICFCPDCLALVAGFVARFPTKDEDRQF